MGDLSRTPKPVPWYLPTEEEIAHEYLPLNDSTPKARIRPTPDLTANGGFVAIYGQRHDVNDLERIGL
ncbi:hypothetical protein D3C80_1625420 [compost metagenome]